VRKPILNPPEALTDVALRASANKHGALVFAKVRLAGVLELSAMDLPSSHRTYALRSHFDFVVTCRHTNPLFAVEFDGQGHATDRAVMRRDAMKAAICDRGGFPLLRVDSGFLRAIDRVALLTWFVDVWFRSRSWLAAQQRGEIPQDEPFPAVALFRQTDGRIDPFHSLHLRARDRIMEAYRAGICSKWAPEHVWRFDEEVDRYSVAHALLGLTAGGFLFGSARCLVTRFGPVRSWEIAAGLAEADLGQKLDRYRQGRRTPATADQLAELRAETAGWMRSGYLLDEDSYIIPMASEPIWSD
jgi:Protein of unknown function (DUF2726)